MSTRTRPAREPLALDAAALVELRSRCERAVRRARRIAEAAPQGELVVLDGAGHFPFAEDPEAYWGTVRDWLAR